MEAKTVPAGLRTPKQRDPKKLDIWANDPGIEWLGTFTSTDSFDLPLVLKATILKLGETTDETFLQVLWSIVVEYAFGSTKLIEKENFFLEKYFKDEGDYWLSKQIIPSSIDGHLWSDGPERHPRVVFVEGVDTFWPSLSLNWSGNEKPWLRFMFEKKQIINTIKMRAEEYRDYGHFAQKILLLSGYPDTEKKENKRLAIFPS
ncbi:hypothetical protein RFI_13112 [Reticulomyxa filosa]|uniref:Uncharacterized protein n=1 Tax=Reticulomyxa filosa TaxID=46433 RepID=X6NFC9_RETFI|nr:hypothetical protein RFI_13112 [Reticulomyxa filosa]|eukprot:ETO24047.1 hypothetical protein RFI_13112 [Reticulomyxa filosa]